MRGSRHEITVESLANSGNGVGRINDKVVFIPLACPGDKLLIQITKDKKTFCLGKIIEVLEASKDRTEPTCQHFGLCGGCDLQHIQYKKQIFWKHKALIDVLQRIGKLNVDKLVSPVQPCSKEYFYRNRIQLHFDRKGHYYLQKGSQSPCYIDACPIADPQINEWLEKEVKSSSQKKGKVEIAVDTLNGIQTYPVNDIGQSELGFRQVNDEQNEFIAQKILQLIEQENVQNITDLYCGQGNWSLSIAKQNAQVQCLGIDINPTNIEKANLKKLPNTQFLLGDVYQLKDRWEGSTAIIIDPPRAGCSAETIQLLTEHPSSWLIYISCHPATMARDLQTLINKNWSIQSITPVDMFPQTSHLECLTILRGANRLKTANP